MGDLGRAKVALLGRGQILEAKKSGNNLFLSEKAPLTLHFSLKVEMLGLQFGCFGESLIL